MPPQEIPKYKTSPGYLNNNPYNIKVTAADISGENRWQGVKTAEIDGVVVPVNRDGEPLRAATSTRPADFLVFTSWGMGERAGLKNHVTHQSRDGDNTIRKLIIHTTPVQCRKSSAQSTFSSVKEFNEQRGTQVFSSPNTPDYYCDIWENSPESVKNYINYVADWVGVEPDDDFNIVNPSNFDQIKRFSDAIIAFEIDATERDFSDPKYPNGRVVPRYDPPDVSQRNRGVDIVYGTDFAQPQEQEFPPQFDQPIAPGPRPAEPELPGLDSVPEEDFSMDGSPYDQEVPWGTEEHPIKIPGLEVTVPGPDRKTYEVPGGWPESYYDIERPEEPTPIEIPGLEVTVPRRDPSDVSELEGLAPDSYRRFRASQHPGAMTGEWEDSPVEDWQVADSRSVRESAIKQQVLDFLRRMNPPEAERLEPARISDIEIPIRRQKEIDLTLPRPSLEEPERFDMDIGDIGPVRIPGLDVEVEPREWHPPMLLPEKPGDIGYEEEWRPPMLLPDESRRFDIDVGDLLSRPEEPADISGLEVAVPRTHTPSIQEMLERSLRRQRKIRARDLGRAYGGIVGVAGGGYLPGYAYGGYLPGYSRGGITGLKKGGFWSGLWKGFKKVAPIALGAWNPLAGAGLGALLGGLEKDKSGKRGGWGGALKGGAIGGLGGAALKSVLAGGGGIGSLLKGQGWGGAMDSLGGFYDKAAPFMPMIGALSGMDAEQQMSQQVASGEGPYGSVPHAQMPGQPIMPGQQGRMQAQGYATMPTMPTRAHGGMIPGYQSGGGEFGGEMMGGYPAPAPVAQQIQPFVPTTQSMATVPQGLGWNQGRSGANPLAKLPKTIQEKINTGKKLTKKENQRVRKLPKEDQQIVKNTVARQKNVMATDQGSARRSDVPRATVDPRMRFTEPPGGGSRRFPPPPGGPGFAPPPPTGRGSAGQPPGGWGSPGEMGGEGGPDMSGVMEALPATQAGLPPGGYVGPGGRGGEMGGEGGPDMGAGGPGGYVPPGGGMGGIEEALPATGYNPFTGQGYVPPGGVPQAPAQLPQGAGLADTSGGVKPTDWLKAEFKKQNPDSDSTDSDIIQWAARTGTPNTEGGWEGGPGAGVELEDVSKAGTMAIMKDPDTGMLKEYHPQGDQGSYGIDYTSPLDNEAVADLGDEIASPGTRTSVGTTSSTLGTVTDPGEQERASRREKAVAKKKKEQDKIIEEHPEAPWLHPDWTFPATQGPPQPPPQPWQPPTQAAPIMPGGGTPTTQPPTQAAPIMPGGGTPAAGYHAGYMPETSYSTGAGPVVGFDPFQKLPTQASQFADPATQAMMARINAGPQPYPGPPQTQLPAPRGPIDSGKAEGGLIGSSEISIEDVVMNAIQEIQRSPDNPPPWALELLEQVQEKHPKLLERIIAAMTQEDSIITEGYIPDFQGQNPYLADENPQDTMYAIDKDELERPDFAQRMAAGGPFNIKAALDDNEFIFSEAALAGLKRDDEPFPVAADKLYDTMNTLKNYNGPHALDLKVVKDRHA